MIHITPNILDVVHYIASVAEAQSFEAALTVKVTSTGGVSGLTVWNCSVQTECNSKSLSPKCPELLQEDHH